MQMFSEEESRARRQIHELFAAGYLHTCPKNRAIHEDPWTPSILEDILHCVYQDNPFTPSELEVFLRMGGYYDMRDELWFTYEENTPVIEPILLAIARYITPKAYVYLKQRMIGIETNSARRFYQVCVDNKLPKKKVKQGDVYELYCEWCEAVRYKPVSRIQFKKEMLLRGVPEGKGYVDRSCGVSYYLIAVSMEEDCWDVQKVRAKDPKKEAQDPYEPLRSVGWRGEKDSFETSLCTADELSAIEEESDHCGDAEGDFEESESGYEENESTDSVDDDFAPRDESKSSAPDNDGRDNSHASNRKDVDDDSEVWEVRSDEDGAAAPGALSGRNAAGVRFTEEALPRETRFDSTVQSTASAGIPKEVVMAEFKKLPKPVRDFFKLMKVTYLVNPEHFSYEDFYQYYMTSDLPYATQDEIKKLYQGFLIYVK